MAAEETVNRMREITPSSVISTCIFIVTFVLIGVPLWWKTTEVYRYDVPHLDCQLLLTEPIIHAISVKLILADRNVHQSVLWEELYYSSKELEKEFEQPRIALHWTMSAITEAENELLHKFKKISDLDSALNDYVDDNQQINSLRSYEELNILVLPQNFMQGPTFSIGNGRFGYILNGNDSGSEHLVKDILSIVQKMAQFERLSNFYSHSQTSSCTEKKPDKDRMRSLKSSVSFDVTFSLIVPEPQNIDVQWNIENAIDAYMKPFLEELIAISTVNIKSQVLYMTSLPVPTHLPLDDNGEEFILHTDHLPSIINPIEARLGSETSVHPNLNFVVYIPSANQTPLRIYDASGQPLETNAFLLPQWGGFLIYNCLIPKNSPLPFEFHLNDHSVMQVFLSQFRLLLGLPDINALIDDNCQVLSSPSIRKWETDFLLRKNAQEHLTAAASSLSSLSKLLQTIGNIVIKDDVGEKIHFALKSSKKSLEYLSKGYLKEGFLTAKSAFMSSDEAFFDPSLLSLLYFPEDQKYAIYIPLFLPISIPVLTSVMRPWNFWKNKAKKDVRMEKS